MAAELGNRAGIERTVGVSWGLRVGEAADMHGRYDLSCAPAAIVEPGVTPVVGEATRIEYLGRVRSATGALSQRRSGCFVAIAAIYNRDGRSGAGRAACSGPSHGGR